ncbi:MAG: DUF4476 domain-containing protein [Ignavibacteria bacterium]|nr:DUF4476 domain-containing protein [Ignavibacteria bacterium]
MELDGKDCGYFQEEYISKITEGNHTLRIFDGLRASLKPVFDGKVYIPDASSIFAVINSNLKYEVYKTYKNKESSHICNCDCEYCRNCIYKDPNGRRYNNETSPGNNGPVINEKDFSELMTSLGNMSYDDNKREMISMVLDKYYVTSEHVKSLLTAVTFENNKLEVAKYAYARTVDKENYYKVLSSFTFESTIEELKDFISK